MMTYHNDTCKSAAVKSNVNLQQQWNSADQILHLSLHLPMPPTWTQPSLDAFAKKLVNVSDQGDKILLSGQGVISQW